MEDINYKIERITTRKRPLKEQFLLQVYLSNIKNPEEKKKLSLNERESLEYGIDWDGTEDVRRLNVDLEGKAFTLSTISDEEIFPKNSGLYEDFKENDKNFNDLPGWMIRDFHMKNRYEGINVGN